MQGGKCLLDQQWLPFSKGLGLIYSLAHQLAPEARVSHSTSIGIFLPNGMKFNQVVAAKQYVTLAHSMNLVDLSVNDEKTSQKLNCQLQI